MNLQSNHPFLSTSQDVKEIAKPLEQFGVNFFGYKRCYKDGSRFYLNSNPEFMRYYFKRECFSFANTESYPRDTSPRIAIWNTVGQPELYKAVKDEFDHDHGLYLIKPDKDYFELFSFATNSKNHSIINTYFTSFEFFLNFTDYFKEKASTIIQQTERNKIVCPIQDIQIGSPFNLTELTASLSKLKNIHPSSSIKLPSRQLECAQYLIQGKSIYQIAEAMHLSPRTIDFYLTILKKKLNCRNKTQLIVRLLEVIDSADIM